VNREGDGWMGGLMLGSSGGAVVVAVGRKRWRSSWVVGWCNSRTRAGEGQCVGFE